MIKKECFRVRNLCGLGGLGFDDATFRRHLELLEEGQDLDGCLEMYALKNNLTKVPSLVRFKNLRKLKIQRNKNIKYIPNLAYLVHLRELDAKRCGITKVHHSIAELPLTVLKLQGNPFPERWKWKTMKAKDQEAAKKLSTELADYYYPIELAEQGMLRKSWKFI